MIPQPAHIPSKQTPLEEFLVTVGDVMMCIGLAFSMPVALHFILNWIQSIGA